MSNHLISEVYKRQVGNIARKAVMGLLADKASDDGSGIWASKQRMADEIGASKQTVIATLKGLTADGLVREAGMRKCTNGYTVEYAINVAALKALPLVKSHQDDQSEDLTGQATSPVKGFDATSQILLPDQSEDLTQTLQNPNKPSEDKSADTDRITVDEVFEGWNSLAGHTGLPAIAKRTEARTKTIRRMARDYPVDDWVKVFAKIEQSPFLTGANDRGWKADLDFVLTERNFVKILEGKYDRQPTN